MTPPHHGRKTLGRLASLAAGGILVLGLSTLLVGMASAPPAASPPGSPLDSARAVLPGFLGRSGNLRSILATPERAAENPVLRVLLAPFHNLAPGIRPLAVTAPDGGQVNFLGLIPFRAKDGARLGRYNIGFWPGESGRKTRSALPEGFIEVTPANAETPVSKRFRLADFLTHDQQDVWPKYLVLQPKLLDKLELIGEALARAGLSSRLHVMSGFRTPQYNAKGVGPKGGRARDSQHMYGDAADVFVDADGNGVMDDLDGDGRTTIADAQVLERIAERVEIAHPDLIGGLGLYHATSAHGPFVHVDARGYRARW